LKKTNIYFIFGMSDLEKNIFENEKHFKRTKVDMKIFASDEEESKSPSAIEMFLNHKNSGPITVDLIPYDTNNYLIKPHKRKIGDIHLARLLNKKFNNTFTTDITHITKVVKYIAKTVPDLTGYCVGCGEILDVSSDLYINCAKDECVYKCEELPIGNIVTNFAKDKPIVAKVLLKTGIDSARSSRRDKIFEPFPHYFLKADEHLARGELSVLTGKNIEKLKDYKSLDKTMNTTFLKQNPATTINKLAEFSSDMELEEVCGLDVYNFLRFLFMSAEFRLDEVDLFSDQEKGISGSEVSINISKKGEIKAVRNDPQQSKTRNFRHFRLIHTPEKERMFKKQANDKNTCYLFHGSNNENWYSIMRNGVKNASNSKIMVNAAAYGSGIYTASNVVTSLGYSRSAPPKIVGVFEAASPTPNKWKPGCGIYVVTDAKDLILRYVLYFEPNTAPELSNLINDKFNVTLKSNEKKQKSSTSKLSNKRMLKEIKKMQSAKTRELGISAIPREDNLMIWDAYMHQDGFDPDDTLTKDLNAKKIDSVHLEVHIPHRYPFEPPFIMVISPKFKCQTGHITMNGAICHEILAPKKWLPTYSIESLLIDIRSNILQGGAELDPHNWKGQYSFSGAKSDYERVMRAHGWLN
jgi:ubiquitin-protein ligase